MFNYEIGGNEKKADTSEAFGDISPNKTLFIQKLTDQEPLKPEAVSGLKTVEDVFAHYKPALNISLENKDGGAINEKIAFKNLGDFNVKSLIKQSKHLHKMNLEKDMYQNMIKQIKTNKTLKTTLNDQETKEAFLSALKSFVKELEK